MILDLTKYEAKVYCVGKLLNFEKASHAVLSWPF